MSQSNLVQFAQNPQVSIVKGQPITTSLNVSQVFERNHKEVLRSIDKLLKQVPENISKRNFAPSVYTDSTGKGNPYYELAFDGFMLLVMGFTGAKAMQFKIAYIEAFNKMREQLSGNPEPLTLTPSTAEDRKPLTSLVQIWAKQSNQKFSDCYRQVNAYFNLEGIADLPVEWLPDAIDFVQQRIDAHQLAIENHQAALPAGQEIPTQNNCPFAPVAFTEAEIKVKKHLIDRLERVLCILQEDQMFYKLWARMGVRILGLPKEKQLLYEAGEAHMDAFRGHMYLAQRSLKSALEIEVNVKFD